VITGGPHDAELRRAIAWGGAAFVAVAILGFALVPSLAIVWAVLFIFGVATVPQWLLEWYRECRGTKK
jgi:Flp pilus assembly protein TadB